MDGMKRFVVKCIYEAELEYKFNNKTWFFECWAEDADHAKEQALDSEQFVKAISIYKEIDENEY